MQKTTVFVKGMHCHSCELLIESELKKVGGVVYARAKQSRGKVDIGYSGILNDKEVSCAIQNAGYSVAADEEQANASKLPWISPKGEDFIFLFFNLLIFAFLYLVFKVSGIGSSLSFGGNDFSSLPVVFLVGLTAGVSTCMALVGGLVLGISARFAEKNQNASGLEKFEPHLFFNLGRIVSFIGLGMVGGLIGSVFKFSPGLTGVMAIIAGMFMLFLGLQLTKISPRLSSISISLPAGLGRALGLGDNQSGEYSEKNAMIMGALTFFLPCGFTQAVQLYAISTGDPIKAGLTMGAFALGTAPGLLGVGGITSFLKGTVGEFVFKFVGIVVAGLAIFNITNGLRLTGIGTASAGTAISEPVSGKDKVNPAPANGEVQLLKATYSVKQDMQPNNFTVTAGKPVRLEVKALEDGQGCMGSLFISGAMKQPQFFSKDETIVVEFTPSRKGKYVLACAMGVPRGAITVN